MYLLWRTWRIAILLLALSQSCVAMRAAKGDTVERSNCNNADTIARIRKPVQSETPDLVNILMLDFYATFNAIRFENAPTRDLVTQLNVYYNFNLDNQVKTRYFLLRTTLFNEYGFCHYLDSVTVKTEDNLRLRNNIQLTLYQKLSAQAGFEMSTQCWRKWLPEPDSSKHRDRFLYSDYMSPGYLSYSAGLGFDFLEGGVAYLGLAAGKITRIRNQRIFEERGAENLYGVAIGEKQKLDWGLNLTTTIPVQKLSRQFYWEFNSNLFVPGLTLPYVKSYTCDATLVLHYVFFRFLRLSLRTQFRYDEQIQTKVFISQHFSLGFYLSNKL